MNMNCQHDVDIKMVNGSIVSYCKKCGAILGQQSTQTTISCESISSGLKDNGGQILHD